MFVGICRSGCLIALYWLISVLRTGLYGAAPSVQYMSCLIELLVYTVVQQFAKAVKTKIEKKKLVETFEKVLEMVGHPMFKEVYGKSEEMYMFSKEIRMFTHRFLDRFISEAN